MIVAFDSAKDAINQIKHGISLQAADDFDWATALEREDDRFDYGEVRFVAIGRIGAVLHVLVFTEAADEQAIRAISLRRADRHEMRFYHDHVQP